MKVIAVIGLIFFGFIENTHAQPIFQRIYKGNGETKCNYAEQTTDGGFILAGGPFVVKTDSSGFMVWSKLYWGPQIQCIHQTADGGYVMAGRFYQGVPDYDDGVIIKTDSIGNIIWANTYGGFNFQLINDIEKTRDGGFILSGKSADSSSIFHLTLIKYDAAGNQIWSKCYRDNSFNKVRQTSDGGYIVAGFTRAGCGQYNGTIIKIDSLGNLSWQKDYCDSYFDEINFYDIQITSDSGFIICGRAPIPKTVFNADLLLIKTDSIGNIMWQKAYAGSHSGSSAFWGVQQTPDGGYVAVGPSGDYGATYSDAILVKTDSTGDIQWSKVYGRTTGQHTAISTYLTTDGGFLLAGYITPPGASGNDTYFYLIKTDSIGNSGCYEDNAFPNPWQTTIQANQVASSDTVGLNSFPVTINVTTPGAEYEFCSFIASLPESFSIHFSIKVYPNPTNGNFIISSNELLDDAQIRIYNVLGEEVYSDDFNGQQKTIDNNFNAGIYFIEITDGKVRWTENLIKQ